jgi:hypothetical protein
VEGRVRHVLGQIPKLIYAVAHGKSLLKGDYEPTHDDMRTLYNLEVFIDDNYRPQLRYSAESVPAGSEDGAWYTKADARQTQCSVP